MLKQEERHGRDIRALIAEAVREHGTVEEAAKVLEIKPCALYRWLKLLQGELKPRYEVWFEGFEEDQAA